MPGFGKENLNAKQDDEPPETRSAAAKPQAAPPASRSGASEVFRRSLAEAAKIRFSSPACSEESIAFRAKVLKELLGGLGKQSAYKELVEPNLDAVVGLISSGIFRPINSDEYRDAQGEPDEPVGAVLSDLCWVHRQPVYEVLHQLFLNPLVDRKQLRDLVDAKFVDQYLDLFESEEQVERDSLKVTLHRIYIHLVSRRKQIRAKISAIFEASAHDLRPHPGLPDLIEFFSSVVSGFNTPLQEEHVRTFRGSILPLQKLPTYRDFQRPLGTCLALYICKDESLAREVVKSILRFWPCGNTKKETAFLIQLLGVVEHVKSLDCLGDALPPLLTRVARSVASFCAPVCDRALVFFLNAHFMAALKKSRRFSLSLFRPAVGLAKSRQWGKGLLRAIDKVAGLVKELDEHSGPDASQPNPNFAQSIELTPEREQHRQTMDSRWEVLAAELASRDPSFVAPPLPYTDRRLPRGLPE